MEKEDQVGAPDDQTSTRESDSADMPPQAKSEAGERSGNPAETSGAHNTNGAATKGDSSQRMKRARAVYGQQAELLLAKHSDKNGCIKVRAPPIASLLQASCPRPTPSQEQIRFPCRKGLSLGAY